MNTFPLLLAQPQDCEPENLCDLEESLSMSDAEAYRLYVDTLLAWGFKGEVAEDFKSLPRTVQADIVLRYILENQTLYPPEMNMCVYECVGSPRIEFYCVSDAERDSAFEGYLAESS